ncbi:hypothetical protein OG369_36380 [Streptomyces sp. NBC_01221]|uniref:hypothetical protein n=1 Tax=Streptomyces sp. NBC_01221 TaxID=2903782 RepID=UPI0022560346|nr:hypothetical protein [Streptomyces sp. NBC_01221]MCX4791405.1 hypothetical protein [Streptomyces sp. NBC_01221]
MNVTELLVDLRSQHEAATARAGELQGQIDHLTAALAETEARLTELDIARKVIAEAAPAATEPDPPQTETSTAYQAIVNAFNQHAARCSGPVNCTNSSTCPPTRHPSTSPEAASHASSAKASSPNPDEAATRNGLNVH